MSFRRVRSKLNLVLIISGTVIVGSYAFLTYLAYIQQVDLNSVQNVLRDDKREEQLLATARTHLESNRTEQALFLYREVLLQNPTSLQAQVGLARGELQAGREEVAAREYERVLKLSDDHRASLLQLARLYSRRSKTWTQSEAKYRRYLDMNPGHHQPRLELARVLTWRSKAREAVEIYSDIPVSKLMTRADRRNYALMLVKLKEWTKAESLLKELISGDPRDGELKWQLAGIYAGRKNWDAALPLLRSVLAERPNDPEVNLLYGLGLVSIREFGMALGPLRKARNANLSDEKAGLAYARALRGAGDLGDALGEYERILPLFHQESLVLREYADVLFEKGRYDRAAKYYRAAYDSGLKDSRLLLGIAGALSSEGKHEAALPYLEEAYQRTPTERVVFELARLLHKVGQNERALNLLHQLESSSSRRETQSALK